MTNLEKLIPQMRLLVTNLENLIPQLRLLVTMFAKWNHNSRGRFTPELESTSPKLVGITRWEDKILGLWETFLQSG